MKKFIFFITISFLAFAQLNSTEAAAPLIRIVSATADISAIVREIAKDSFDIITIVPADVNPLIYDLRDRDLKNLDGAAAVFLHGREKWSGKLKSEAKKYKALYSPVKTGGSWMIPDNNLKAAEEITLALEKIDRYNRVMFRNNLEEYKKKVRETEKEIKESARQYRSRKVICAAQQSGFLKWLGLDVVGEYNLNQEMTMTDFMELIDSSQKAGVRAIIDNRQSSPIAGVQMAQEMGVLHTAITDTPIDKPYIETLKSNVNDVLRIVK